MNSEQIGRRLAKLEGYTGSARVLRVIEVLAANHSEDDIDRFLLSNGIRRSEKDMLIITRAINPDRSVAHLDKLPMLLSPVA
ncbi:hypothetical protein C8J35_103521 [Rhizobium sp. PP-F2F-G38]|nr:hypothetical protein C8J35_103521 [Rhizobium sp. PP-F2F-G38]